MGLRQQRSAMAGCQLSKIENVTTNVAPFLNRRIGNRFFNTVCLANLDGVIGTSVKYFAAITIYQKP